MINNFQDVCDERDVGGFNNILLRTILFIVAKDHSFISITSIPILLRTILTKLVAIDLFIYNTTTFFFKILLGQRNNNKMSLASGTARIVHLVY